MATDEPYVRRSVKDLAAGLTPGEVGRVPITSKPAKPIVKPKINRSISASVPPVGTSAPQASNQPAGDPSGIKPPPVLPARRPTDKPSPPSAPPRRGEGTNKTKPPVPSLPPRRPTDTPSLPSRRPSEASSTAADGLAVESPVPSLPPRRPSDRPELHSRRASQASLASTVSAVSSVSKVCTASARTNGTARTASSGEQSRVRAPVYDPASLPPLPPKREKNGQTEGSAPRLPTRGKSTISLDRQARDESPPPSLPTRPGSTAVGQQSRRLPPTVIPPARPRPESAVGKINGFTNANGDNGQAASNQAAGVIILNAQNFDDIVLESGKPALVDFSANFCKVCKKLDPEYDELGNDFRHVSDRLVIAKVDCAVEKVIGTRFDIQAWPTIKWFDGSGGPPESYPYGWTYQAFARFIEEKTGLKPQKGGSNTGAPPPVPLNTRPNISELMKTKPSASTASGSAGCLHCRDFSGPDNHAARFPRQNVSSVSQLARDLTSPFPSETDKARAIFKWMHHNVAYDCKSFFGGNVRHVTPEEVVRSGVAVCGGYAGLYADLALKAGLECVMVTGHGKGFGHKPLQQGEPIPPESQGHAWNAVKIDFGGPGGNGQRYWKLIDPCWGAGHLNGGVYKAEYNVRQFNDSNIEFGRKHFPEDRSKQFRADGRVLSWQEYFLGEAGGETPTIFSGPLPLEGFSQSHMLPALKHIPTDSSAHAATGGIVRFQFQRVCDHWNPEVNGQGKDLLYVIPTSDGRKKIPFETNGTYWWCDVHVSKLGKKGTTVMLMTVDSMAGRDSRGMTRDQYLAYQEKGHGSGGRGLAQWELV